jgi:RNA polymerase sigma-70 factor (ECF subfamily)
VRLDSVADGTEVRSPTDYIFRTAINLAKNHRKAQSYRVPASEIDGLIEVSDETPSPAQIAEARSDFEAFERALMQLPERCRHVVRMISLEGRTAQETADRLGISVRTVTSDYQQALQHCVKRPTARQPARPSPDAGIAQIPNPHREADLDQGFLRLARYPYWRARNFLQLVFRVCSLSVVY